MSNILRSSLGPKGMDKMLVSPDGDVTITNDGATILDKMQVEHQVRKTQQRWGRAEEKEGARGYAGGRGRPVYNMCAICMPYVCLPTALRLCFSAVLQVCRCARTGVARAGGGSSTRR